MPRPRRIGEANLFKGNLSACRVGQRNGVGGGCNPRLLVKKFGQPFCSARGLAQLSPDLRQSAQCACSEDGIEQELAERACRHIACQDIMGADPKNADHGAEDGEDRKKRQHGAGQDRRAGSAECRFNGAGEAANHQRFIGEGLHGARRADLFGGVG